MGFAAGGIAGYEDELCIQSAWISSLWQHESLTGMSAVPCQLFEALEIFLERPQHHAGSFSGSRHNGSDSVRTEDVCIHVHMSIMR